MACAPGLTSHHLLIYTPSLPPYPTPHQQAEDMQQDAIDTASQAMEKFNIEKDIASYIKKECE